ncbi:unnamed protein product [Haemonchus placei]|uniref:Fatty-acid and retinol-binding protein 1 n=1 Tax=Haemonchus placei TaxID=6290 RepID=A0A0N4WLB4_HAEPC|nr:unnamed protein product [Haemonchus placei]
MKFLWIFAMLVGALGQVALTPKAILIKKVNDLVTGFLTEQQISKAIDITAFDIHTNKTTEEIMTDNYMRPAKLRSGAALIEGIHLRSEEYYIFYVADLYDYLITDLSSDQLKTVNDSYKALVKDLGEEEAANVMERIKKVFVYAVSPAVDLVRANDATPELAYIAMSRQLTPDFIHGVISLVRDTLTPVEWNSVKQRYASMLRIM